MTLSNCPITQLSSLWQLSSRGTKFGKNTILALTLLIALLLAFDKRISGICVTITLLQTKRACRHGFSSSTSLRTDQTALIRHGNAAILITDAGREAQ